MLLTPTAPVANKPGSFRRRFLWRGVMSAGFGLTIALLLTARLGTPLRPNMVRSVCISMLCWFAIDLLRMAAATWRYRNKPLDSAVAVRRWPGWPLMFSSIVLGTVIGFSLGSELANLILGRAGSSYFSGTLPQMMMLLLGSLVPGTVITYWFYSRETIAAKDAAAQAAQRQAAEHQLKLLESQLEPHMLFNTLANLRVLIGIDPIRAQTMLDQLIAFLRATLAGSRAAHQPLGAEFARTADYLALMQVRMGERLQARFDLPETLADQPVPPLLLQPLVENCIKHGLEPALAGGRIDLCATRQGKTLVLTVRDTGVGLAAGSEDATRFGLVQVRERLGALYGGQASLSLTAAPGDEGGTLATIRLPLTEAELP